MAEIAVINVTEEEITRRKARLDAVTRLEVVSPIPVLALNGDLAYLPWLGISLEDAYRDPELMLRSQIAHAQLVMNTVDCDNCSVDVGVNLGAGDMPSALGCEVFERPGSRPGVKPWVRTEEDLLRLERMDVIHGGLHARSIAMRREMMTLKGKYPIRYTDGDPFTVENIGLRSGAHGPFTLAGEVAGNQEVIIDMVERPDFLHRLLQILTEKEIEWIEFAKQECGLPHEGSSMMDDFAPYLSPAFFEEFALPYAKQVIDHFGGFCSFHYCVLADHLLEYLRDDLRIGDYFGFKPAGSPAEFAGELDRILDVLGNRVCLTPDPDPVKTSALSYDELYAVAHSLGTRLAGYQGIKICCGMVDGAPLDSLRNLNAVAHALRDVAQGS